MVILLILGPLVFTSIVTFFLFNFFEKAGYTKKDAQTPIKNVYLWFKITKRSPYWGILWVVPYINLILIIWLVTEFLKVYGRAELRAQILGILFGYIYLPYLNYKDKKIKYIGRTKIKRIWWREWADALIFAIVAATIIRTFILEAYTIPTSSMEKTLLIGDYLFVSKFHYGARVPNTPLAIPFLHQEVVSGVPAYIDWSPLPYYRMPGFQKVNRNDIVVFNWPDDTGHPIDKKQNYIKRCVAVSGDTLEIDSSVLMINGAPALVPEMIQYNYQVTFKGQNFSEDQMKEMKMNYKWPISPDPSIQDRNEAAQVHQGVWWMPLNKESKEILQGYSNFKNLEQRSFKPGEDGTQMGNWQFIAGVNKGKAPAELWTIDYYGPVVIPGKGMTINLTNENYLVYERCIREYEHNQLERKNGKYYINGKESSSYTFKYDYYFMMGDNRHNSLDSRYWGFVPETYVVGKAWFIWFSIDGQQGFPSGIRWSRIFKPIH